MLRPQDLHGAFDIHKYGTKILHSFVTTRKKKPLLADNTDEAEDTCEEDVSANQLESATGKIIPFRTIATGRPPYDISRLFLATLQLVRIPHTLPHTFQSISSIFIVHKVSTFPLF